MGLDKDTAFEDISSESYPGKWKVIFFWPKDFTFVCPTEIAAFGKAISMIATRRCWVVCTSGLEDASR